MEILSLRKNWEYCLRVSTARLKVMNGYSRLMRRKSGVTDFDKRDEGIVGRTEEGKVRNQRGSEREEKVQRQC